MFLRNVTIPANGETQVRGNSKRIVVRQASAEFELVTDKNEFVVLRQGDNFEFENVAGVLRLSNKTSLDIRLELAIASSSEGNLTASATSMEVINVDEFNAGAGDFDIKTFIASPDGVQILSDSLARRGAVISTSGPVVVSKVLGGPVFTVDGVLTFPAKGALYAQANSETMVEVLEFLN